jgi:hypothetical protein
LAQRACCRIALKSLYGCSFFGSFSFRWVRLRCIPALTDLVARLRFSNILPPHVVVIIVRTIRVAVLQRRAVPDKIMADNCHPVRRLTIAQIVRFVRQFQLREFWQL